MLLVTTIADRKLVALDVATGRVRYTSKLGAEPRAVAPDGTRALVTYLTSAILDEIAVATGHPHRDPVALPGEVVRGVGDRLAVVPFQGSRPISTFTGESVNPSRSGSRPERD